MSKDSNNPFLEIKADEPVAEVASSAAVVAGVTPDKKVRLSTEVYERGEYVTLAGLSVSNS